MITDADSGPGSFRQGLRDANSGACAAPCRLDFQAPASGSLVIALQSALPKHDTFVALTVNLADRSDVDQRRPGGGVLDKSSTARMDSYSS